MYFIFRRAFLFSFSALGLFLCFGVITASSVFAQESAAAAKTSQSFSSLLQNPDLSREDLQTLIVPLSESELGKAAEIWRGFLQSSLEEMASQTIAPENAGEISEDGSPGYQDLLFETQRSLELKYRDILAEWREKGADAAAMKSHELCLKAALKNTLRSFNSISRSSFRTSSSECRFLAIHNPPLAANVMAQF